MVVEFFFFFPNVFTQNWMCGSKTQNGMKNRLKNGKINLK